MSTEKVREHFEADAQRFDAIYEDAGKSPLASWVDNVWRGVVRRRFEITLQKLQPLAGKSVLDVGCGSGRYCIAYATQGAARVVGIDVAANMIEIARGLATQAQVSDRCNFIVGKFPEAVPSGNFDVITANGFFDYIAEPGPLLESMQASTLVMSFPKALEWRVPLRRLRFWMNGCPLYLYSERRVRALLEEAGITRYDWIPLDRDYLVVGYR